MSAHLSELELGRALVRDREPTHVAECARCKAAFDDARAAAARFSTQVRPRTLPAIERRTRQRWAIWIAAATTAVAAACILYVVRPRPRGDRSQITAKGGPALHLVANRRDHVFGVDPGAQLAAGDAIRFVLDTSGSSYLLVVSVDGAGRTNVYYPYGGDRSAPIDERLRHVVLDGSIVLDDAPGPERVWAIASDRPIAVAEVRAQLGAIAAGGAPAIRAGALLAVPDAQQVSTWFEKGKAP